MLSRTFRFAFAVGLIWFMGGERAARGAELFAAPFSVDITPPTGDFACVGFMPLVKTIEHPLELKGLVLSAGDETYVVAAADLCGIANGSDERLRDALAKAAGTSRSRVALQSLHQHSAPALDADSAALLFGKKSERYRKHLAYGDDIAARATSAIEAAMKNRRRVTRIAGSKAKVDRVAANRRVPLENGTIGVRASLTKEPHIRDAAEGTIDPWLRTLTLFAGDMAIAQLHYYGTHPQTFYGDARISWDMVGMSRQRLQEETGIFTIYFTGCGGNVTVGKYNEGNRDSRAALAERMFAAMKSAHQSAMAEPETIVDVEGLPANAIGWATAAIRFTPRDDGPFHPDELVRKLAADRPLSDRLTGACFQAFRERLLAGHVGKMSRFRVGAIDLVHLPGEPFIEFQLFAQGVARERSFVCVAGYGDCGVWYYGPDTIYQDRGGYEQTWSLTGPVQASVEQGLREVLK